MKSMEGNAVLQIDQTQEAIQDVLHARSLPEALARFERNRRHLRGCKFAFASAEGPRPGHATGRDFPNGAAVRSLFATRKVVVLDDDTVEEMKDGGSTFRLDYSISLDTNTLSYLLPYLDGKTSRLPADFADVFTFIAAPETNVDPIPYRLENLLNLTRQPAEDQRIYDRLYAYEILRTLDSVSLAQGMPRSSLTPVELAKRAQEQMASLYHAIDDSALMDAIRHKHGTMYYLLLRMCTLQLAAPRRPAHAKMIDFCDDCDQHLATLFAREMLLARRYFEQGQSIAFFRKIMIKGHDQLAQLRSMAWDLWHVRQMEQAITLRPVPDARYFFPALLTFDKALIEIMDMHPLQACAWVENMHQPQTRYVGDWLREVAGDEPHQQIFIDRFYSPAAVARRECVRDRLKPSLPALISGAESDFRRIAGI